MDPAALSTSGFCFRSNNNILPQGFNNLKKYVPGAIVSRMTCGLSLNVSSLREVVVVFIKLLDIDFLNQSSDTILKRIQSAMEMTQNAAYLVYATLRQFVVDDKGAVAIVAVGLPPYFHEDNSARGVTIALEISENKEHATAVGVTTGVCFCGCVGTAIIHTVLMFRTEVDCSFCFDISY
jgi:hypothetical protein